MPYIKQERRNDIYEALERIDPGELGIIANNAGELNYIITSILAAYCCEKGESYSTYNEIIGVLECAKLEFYRRAVSVYENKKIEENGDVY